jgi:hypothetical protein
MDDAGIDLGGDQSTVEDVLVKFDSAPAGPGACDLPTGTCQSNPCVEGCDDQFPT